MLIDHPQCDSAATADDLFQLLEDVKTPEGLQQVLLEREAIDAWDLMRSEQQQQQVAPPPEDLEQADDTDRDEDE